MSQPRPVPLGAVDLFHLHTHSELRAWGLSGNGCAMVAVLDGRIDEQLLARRIMHAPRLLEELRWRLGRSATLRWVWRARHRLAPAPAFRSCGDREWLDAVMDLLEEPVSGDEPWHVFVLRGAERDAVVFRWFHPLTDARGAAKLIAWLGSGAGSSPPEPPHQSERHADPARLISEHGLRARATLAHQYLRHVAAFGHTPILSLYGASGGSPGRARALRLCFDQDRTRAFYRSLRRRAQLADTSVLLFSAVRMLDAALAARGYSPPQHVVPVPLSLDAKQDDRRMFGNHLTMMMMKLDRDELGDESRAIASLARQRREIVKGKLDVAMLAALDLAGRMPAAIYNWASCSPFGGERSSLVVSNPGEIVLERFLDVPVLEAFSVPTVLARPGLQVIADRHKGRLGVLVVYRENLIGEPELRALLPAFERDLLADEREH